MKYKIYYSKEYTRWYAQQTLKSKLQIDDRLENIKINGHFGKHRHVQDLIYELK